MKQSIPLVCSWLNNMHDFKHHLQTTYKYWKIKPCIFNFTMVTKILHKSQFFCLDYVSQSRGDTIWYLVYFYGSHVPLSMIVLSWLCQYNLSCSDVCDILYVVPVLGQLVVSVLFVNILFQTFWQENNILEIVFYKQRTISIIVNECFNKRYWVEVE